MNHHLLQIRGRGRGRGAASTRGSGVPRVAATRRPRVQEEDDSDEGSLFDIVKSGRTALSVRLAKDLM